MYLIATIIEKYVSEENEIEDYKSWKKRLLRQAEKAPRKSDISKTVKCVYILNIVLLCFDIGPFEHVPNKSYQQLYLYVFICIYLNITCRPGSL